MGAIQAVVASLLRPASAALGPLLLVSSPLLAGLDDSGQAGQAGATDASPQSSPPPAPTPPDGGGLLYFAAIFALLALLAYTVWREFHVALRPWQHRH